MGIELLVLIGAGILLLLLMAGVVAVLGMGVLAAGKSKKRAPADNSITEYASYAKSKLEADQSEEEAASEKILSYRLKSDALLSPAERSFYGILTQLYGESYRIFAKVRIADILQPMTGLNASERTSAQNKINMKHVDFLVCERETIKPIAAVELDDSSHARSDRRIRDTFVDQAFATASVPLIHFENRRSYVLADIEAEVSKYIGGAVERDINESVQEKSDEDAAPVCPKCGGQMHRRYKNNDPSNDPFWGCENFPKCRQIIKIEA